MSARISGTERSSGSQSEGGDRERLLRELDILSATGIDNLRILVGGDGPDERALTHRTHIAAKPPESTTTRSSTDSTSCSPKWANAI